MNQQVFEQQYSSLWQQYDTLLLRAYPERSWFSSRKRVSKASLQNQNDDLSRLPMLYRQICQHYALASQRHYSAQLIDQLHQRVLRGHQVLYQHQKMTLHAILQFIWVVFPTTLRRHWRHFLLASLLFYLPAILMGLACYQDDAMIYSVMDSEQVQNMESMYDPHDGKIGRSMNRKTDTDIQMFGFYVFNNISIGLKTFSMGLLFGVGTVFTLIYNGIQIGAVAGHLTLLGFSKTFWPFVSGHGAFELTAICVSGAAGLRLAQPLIAPGPYRRLDALKLAGKESVMMALGAALMLLVAAFIEAFWSPIVMPTTIKYAVALLLWLSVAFYLGFSGRKVDTHSNLRTGTRSLFSSMTRQNHDREKPSS